MVKPEEMLKVLRSELGDKRFRDVTKNVATFTLWVRMYKRYKERSVFVVGGEDAN